MLAVDGWADLADLELTRALKVGELAGRVIAVVRALGDLLVITGPDERRLAASASLALPADAVVLDARNDELIVRGEPRSLRRHPIRRRLLYALARRPAHVIGKDALVKHVWECAYDPLRHDDTIKSNILHLRRLLAGSGIEIVCGHPGYRLDVAPRFAFVFAFELGRAASPRFTAAMLSRAAAR